MKTITSLILILFLTSCSAPNSFRGSVDISHFYHGNPEIHTDEFKLMFSGYLPKREAQYLVRTIESPSYKNDRFSKQMSAHATNKLILGSGATNLAFTYIDNYIQSQSAMDYSYQYISYADEKINTIEDAHRIAYVNALAAINKMASDFGYTVDCVAHCGIGTDTLELTRKQAGVSQEVYEPYKLVVVLNIRADRFIKLPDDAILKKVVENPEYISSFFYIDIVVPRVKSEDMKIVKYRDDTGEGTSTYPVNFDMMVKTPLGRKMLRSISKELPSWYSFNEIITTEYALMKGKLYHFKDEDKYSTFHGVLLMD